MPLTNAEKQARHRTRKAEKMARMEAALREIQKLEVRDVHDGYDADDGSYIWVEYVRLDDVARLAKEALG